MRRAGLPYRAHRQTEQPYCIAPRGKLSSRCYRYGRSAEGLKTEDRRLKTED